MLRLCYYFLIITLFLGCSTTSRLSAEEEASYKEWKEQRFTNLKSPKGYLSLAGLYWLKPGNYMIGSDASADIIFPDHAPEQIGSINLEKNKYQFNAMVPVHVNGEKKQTAELFTDLSGKVTEVNHGSFYWFLIQRGDKVGLRLKDTLNENRLNFSGVDSYDYNKEYKVQAEVMLAEKGETISITNVVGVTEDQKVGGTLAFKLKGKQCSLKGIGDGYGSWFFVFGDETNSDTTYGGGRFLYVDVEPNASTVIVDFNLAHNPPCFFTTFATCPLPPRENKLPLRIEAGEKADH